MEKSSKKVTVITILLALICVGILGGIVYYKVHRKEEPNKIEENENIKEKEEEKEEEPPVVQENYDEVVQKLYAIISNNPEFRDEEVVNIDTLSESIRDSIVLNNLSSTCEATKLVDKALFDSKYKEIFNQEKISEEGLCTLSDNNYECNRYCSEFPSRIYNKYEKYELTENGIVIYESAAHLDFADDGKVYLKANAIDSAAIASFDTYEDLMDSTVEYKLPTYKHTFIKGDNNYYWVSSESVKQ